jgi:hypothetical protein
MMRAASSMQALTASAASSIAASKATFASSRLRLILSGIDPPEGLAHAGPKMRAATFSAASDCIPLMTCW